MTGSFHIRRMGPSLTGAVLDLIAPEITDAPRRQRLEAYVRRVFFENPWTDPDYAPLIALGPDDAIEGFLGIHRRPMRLGDREIQAAVSSNFFTPSDDAGRRNPLVALRLEQAFFQGPQDLSIAEGANRLSKKIWEGRGGSSIPCLSFDWIVPLRPLATLMRLAGVDKVRPPAAWRSIAARIGDAIAAPRLGRMQEGGATPLRTTPYDPGAVAGLLEARGERRLRPFYTADALNWLLATVAMKARTASVRSAMVADERGRAVGCYVFLEKQPGVADVVQLASAPGTEDGVLRAVIADARRQGFAFVRGDVDPPFLQAYHDLRAMIVAGRHVLARAADDGLMRPLHEGRACINAIDGERAILDFDRLEHGDPLLFRLPPDEI